MAAAAPNAGEPKANKRKNAFLVEEYEFHMQALDTDPEDLIYETCIVLPADCGFDEYDTVEVIGQQSRTLLMTVVHFIKEKFNALPGRCRLARIAMTNLGVQLNQKVKIRAVLQNVPQATSCLLSAFSDTVAHLRDVNPAMLFQNFIKPLFSTNNLPLSRDQCFNIRRDGMTVEFKVMRLSTEGRAREDGTKEILDVRYATVGSAHNRPDVMISCSPELLNRDEVEESQKIGYRHLGGIKPQLDQIREMCELPLRHPAIFRTLGIAPPKGLLMYGPPGTGKTTIARAIANEVGAKLLVIDGPEVIAEKEPEKKIEEVFEAAAKEEPAIIFIDEIDVIGVKRDKADPLLIRIVSALLIQMDGLKKRKQTIVIGATNRPNVLDPALRRFGRFDRELELGVPNQEGRLEILRIHTEKAALETDPTSAVKVNLDKLAADAFGYVGADLAQLVSEACMECIGANRALLGWEDETTIDAETLKRLRINQEHFERAMGKIHPSALRELAAETPETRFADLGGMEEIKKRLRETIDYPMHFPSLYQHFGKDPPRGILMFGPPGCGKTLVAKALAGEMQANFISIKGPQLLSSWFGQSEANVREVFQKAKQTAPCVLFFDEIDSITQKRGTNTQSDGGVSDRVINQLLTELDGFDTSKDVFVIAATNRLDTVDDAIIRPGRFDIQICIKAPTARERVLIFQATMRKTPMSDDLKAFIPRCCDPDVGIFPDGTTGADIALVAREAANIAISSIITDFQDKFKAEGKALSMDDAMDITTAKQFDGKFTVTLAHVLQGRQRVKLPSLDKSVLDDYNEQERKMLNRQGQIEAALRAGAQPGAPGGRGGAGGGAGSGVGAGAPAGGGAAAPPDSGYVDGL